MNYDIIRAKFADRKQTSARRINPISSKALVGVDWIEPDQEFADAAVLVPLFQGRSGVELLLTQRSEQLKHHAGQVSFPGGKRELGDACLEATAIRETTEETGIPAHMIEVVGHLPKIYTISYYDVDPIVSLLTPGFKIVADPSEVKEVFSVPLSHFADSNNQVWVEREFKGEVYPLAEFHYEGQRIWGATAAMILALMDVLWRAEEPAVSVMRE